jgi:selenide,water dikinase
VPGAGAAGGEGTGVLVGPESGDDAGVFRLDGHALVATVDFIPPVGDDPRRFGRIAAANAMSDVWAMGGEPMFALNVCAFPADLPEEVPGEILAGGLEALRAAGCALLGGHSVRDRELKYGLAVVGRAEPDRLLTNRGAHAGDRLVLTKPLGTGVLINAFKLDRLDAAGLEPALAEMERLNRDAARLALENGARAATDVTGFGLAGHAWNLARESRLRLELRFDALPVHAGFFELVRAGVSTGCTPRNSSHAAPHVELRHPLAGEQAELLYDPQTSGGLLVAVPPERAAAYLAALLATGHRAAEVGTALDGSPGLTLR